MKKFTVILFAVSLMWVSACDDKEEIVLPKKIEANKSAHGQSGGGDHGSEPGEDD